MVGLLMKCGSECLFHFPNPLYFPLSPLVLGSLYNKISIPSPRFKHFSSSYCFITGEKVAKFGVGFMPPDCLPKSSESQSVIDDDRDGDNKQEEDRQQLQPQEVSRSEFGFGVPLRGVVTIFKEAFPFPQGSSAIICACYVGLLTGFSVVLFNNGVHEIRDLFWDGIPNRGASWLREESVEVIWKRVILVPVSGGLIVSIINMLRDALQSSEEGILKSNVKAALQPFLKAIAACITLGTGNSLGPEGPCVEIGASIAKGYGTLFDKSAERKLSFVAAGSAAGIASGFNAAVAGCFFAVESVLWPSPTNSSLSLTNTTSMVILSAVIASVVSEVGLGSQPAFKVPEYDFRSPSELPLYLLLGLLCGLVSLTLSRCTSYLLVAADNFHKDSNIPKAVFPVMGGLGTGLIALAYPEILYWGFENVDILLESRPFVKGLSADLLVQLVAAKIVATSFCRASGLVGGYYAPSLFIGAATGMAYGKLISLAIAQSNPILHLSVLEVASPQAYALVGMAATLAGVCQVPLTSVLLLFELTQDYRIVLPLLGAVGLSSWITSGQMKGGGVQDIKNSKEQTGYSTQKPETSSYNPSGLRRSYSISRKASNESDLCEVESSLCLGDSNIETSELEKVVFVSQAMRTRYVTVLMGTSLTKAVTLMLVEKQSCAMIVDKDNILLGLLTLGGIQEFSKSAKVRSKRPRELLVSDICSLDGEICRVLCTATPSMDLSSAEMLMNKQNVNLLPVVSENAEEQSGKLVGLLDRECINIACRVEATRELLS